MKQEQHPITPPDELVMEWINKHYGGDVRRGVGGVERTTATQAARWGADMELEACRKEIVDGAGRLYIDDPKLRVRLADDICAARRPKPPSLKEQALELVDRLEKAESPWVVMSELATIRRALEQLDD